MQEACDHMVQHQEINSTVDRCEMGIMNNGTAELEQAEQWDFDKELTKSEPLKIFNIIFLMFLILLISYFLLFLIF